MANTNVIEQIIAEYQDLKEDRELLKQLRILTIDLRSGHINEIGLMIIKTIVENSVITDELVTFLSKLFDVHEEYVVNRINCFKQK